MEKYGFEITYLPVDNKGRISPDDLKAALRDDTILVTIMLANNETGAILPIRELAEITHQQETLFHTDATQAVGKIHVDVIELGVDMLTLSGHKLYGPKGVGALFVKKDVELEPLIHGGSQESGQRAGTEDLLNIIGLGKAAEVAQKHLPNMNELVILRNYLQDGILEIIPEVQIVGDLVHRLPNTLCLILPDMRGESVTMALDQRGISISSGSACRSGSPKPSHTLLACGLSEEEAHCAIRLSVGTKNNLAEIKKTIKIIGELVKDNSSVIRFVPCR